jgi:hypothetical protein
LGNLADAEKEDEAVTKRQLDASVAELNATIDGIGDSDTIYTANGTLTADRTVTLGTNSLNFTGSAGSQIFLNAATQVVIGGAQFSCTSTIVNMLVGSMMNVTTPLTTFSGTGQVVFGNTAGAGTAGHASAQVEIASTAKGFRIKPMTAAQASAITPAEGLFVFVSDTNGTFTSIGLWCYENAAWAKL